LKEDAKQQSKAQPVAVAIQTPSVQNQVTTPKIEEVETPKLERVNKPLGRTGGSAFSLKSGIKVRKETNEEEEVLSEDLPRNPFTLEEVKLGWNKFLEQLKKEHSIPAYNALSTTEIKLLDETTIQLEFISASSESEYDTFRKRIINNLRGTLQNYYFKIDVKLSEAEAKNHVLTTKQKFELFVAKNPIINNLKDEFGLDLFE